MVFLKLAQVETQISRQELVETIIEFERRNGTLSGGMDQTISVFGQHLSALHIKFSPSLQQRLVAFQSECVFVLGNSLTESLKAISAYKNFNKRVFEVRMGTAVMIRILFPSLTEKQYKQKYSQIKNFWSLKAAVKIQGSELLEIIKKSFKTHRLSGHQVPLSDILQFLKIEKVEEIFGEDPLIRVVVEKNKHFALEPRLIHVLGESMRVQESVRILDQGGDLSHLGKLMNDSHRSSKDNFRSSTTMLDYLTQKSLESGALGSSLTGAGWGGCYISLIPKEKVKIYFENILKTYY